MKKPDSNLDDLYQELAGRFAALGQLFSQLSSPEATQGLIESLTSGDPATFKQLTDRVDIPILGKCFWVREIIESVVCSPARLVDECRLRENLTLNERGTYIKIFWQHNGGKFGHKLALQGPVIPTGPFLDELKANGLVTCTTRWTQDCGIGLVLEAPERICV